MCSALVPSRGLCRIFAYRTRHTQCAAEGHERLLLKLNRCGIDGQLQLLFRNFLTNRKKKEYRYVDRIPNGRLLYLASLKAQYWGRLCSLFTWTTYLTSNPKLFADDTKIHRAINKVEDSIALQSDLTTLDLWADRWQVKFNPSKCEVMRITHNKNKSTTRYQVSGTELRNVTSYKDLGVIMASDLTWTINMFIKETRFLAYLNAQ